MICFTQRLTAALGCLAAVALLARADEPAEGLRRVEVQRFGVVADAPLAWRLIRWGQDDQAFVLSLPQEEGSAAGYVTCDLAIAPESLEQYKKRHDADNEQELLKEKPRRRMLLNQIEPLDEKQFGPEKTKQLKERLVTLWEYPEKNGKRFEMCVRLVSDETLYSLTLATDEAHFDAYRLDFEELIAGASFSPPETGLRRMPGGFWMQRDYFFAIKLPPEWKPGFGANDKVLFFAKGSTHQVFTDNLLVLASPSKPLDLEALRTSIHATIKKADPAADAPTCQIVAQGTGKALETVVSTKRGPLAVTVLERRFSTPKRNYEVKFTCETSQFKKIEAELRKALDSFREVAEEGEEGLL